MEESFLKAIEANPDQATPKSIYADWLDEQGRGSDADAMRWLAANGKYPHYATKSRWFKPSVLEGFRWHWISDEVWGNFKEHKIPVVLIKHMKRKTLTVAISNSLFEAISSFFDAWTKATTQPSWFWRLLGYKAWVPDYTAKEPLELSQETRSRLLDYTTHRFDRDEICVGCKRSKTEISQMPSPCNKDANDGYPTIL